VVVIHDGGWESMSSRDSTLIAALEAAVRAL
jgi:hypothetical protein